MMVMPQCPLGNYWTDPEILAMAMATLDQESAEFHGDPDRTYLTGLSMGGYGAWELARLHPHRWAAIAIAAGGIFWSYEPERWQQASTLPAEYARALGHTPVWLFHGQEDQMVVPRQSELMYEALKANGGHVRLWLYQGLHHDCWTRAFDEPELPRWLLAHRSAPGLNESRNENRSEAKGVRSETKFEQAAFSERLLIPLHPPPSVSPPLSLKHSLASTAICADTSPLPSFAKGICSTRRPPRATFMSWLRNRYRYSFIPLAAA